MTCQCNAKKGFLLLPSQCEDLHKLSRVTWASEMATISVKLHATRGKLSKLGRYSEDALTGEVGQNWDKDKC